jgi:glutathionylspermidine synthase
MPPDAFEEMRRRMCLDHSKWDPQVGDVGTLADFPLILSGATWQQLSHWAEALTEELLSAEREIIRSRHLMHRIGVPRALRRQTRSTLDTPRIVRFDFHPTPAGWRISEANADVPGGFNEGSNLPVLLAPHVPNARAAGDPLGKWADLVACLASRNVGVVALVCAPGFMEDAQVVAGLGKRLAQRGVAAQMCAPRNLLWQGDCQASLWGEPVSAIVRFVQSEWLPTTGPQWQRWWTTRVPVLNPPTAAIAESKRLPLVWDQLETAMPTWRALLPTTADPREVSWRSDEWIVKPAYGNTGDDVACIAWTPPRDRRRLNFLIRLQPRSWVAQRRFQPTPIQTPMGLCHPCIGVFTIGGIVAGAYGRIAFGPIVDYRAIDAAVLIRG